MFRSLLLAAVLALFAGCATSNHGYRKDHAPGSNFGKDSLWLYRGN